MSFIPSLKMLVKGLFSKPSTAMYPAKPREFYPRTRGAISNRIDECIFCGICSKKCPTRALTVSRPDREWSIDRFACITCGACVDACPKKCLDMTNHYTPPAVAKSVEHLKQPPAPASDETAAAQTEKREPPHA